MQSSHIKNINDLDINKISIEDINTNQSISMHKLKMLKYEYSPDNIKQITFVTKPIKFTQYGIAKICMYHPDDKTRTYFKIPHDSNQQNSVELFNKLKEIDDYIISKKDEMFGTNNEKYVYIPLVKNTSQEYEDDFGLHPKKTNWLPSCKVAFKLNHDVAYNDDNKINTKVFVKDGDNYKEIDNITTASDMEKYVGWNTTARFAIKISKLWIEKVGHGHTKEKYFGLKLVCFQIESINENTIDENNKVNKIKSKYVNAAEYYFDDYYDYDCIEECDRYENDNDEDDINCDIKNENIVEKLKEMKKRYAVNIDAENLVVDI